MNTAMRKITGILFAALLLGPISVNAEELEGIAGKMISVDSFRSSIEVRTEVPGLFGPVERNVSLSLAPDVKWTICLGGNCVEKTGMEGAQMIESYREYEPYGLMVEGCDVSLVKSGDAITEVWFEIC